MEQVNEGLVVAARVEAVGCGSNGSSIQNQHRRDQLDPRNLQEVIES